MGGGEPAVAAGSGQGAGLARSLKNDNGCDDHDDPHGALDRIMRDLATEEWE